MHALVRKSSFSKVQGFRETGPKKPSRWNWNEIEWSVDSPEKAREPKACIGDDLLREVLQVFWFECRHVSGDAVTEDGNVFGRVQIPQFSLAETRAPGVVVLTV